MLTDGGPPDLGFGFKSFKKLGKGAFKIAKAGVKYTVVAPTKLALKYTALLPLKFALRAVRAVGRTLCRAPQPALQVAATAANVDPTFVPLFCTAVRENKINSLGAIKRMLPPALKVASKLAAAGMFPPIVPVLAVVKRMPYVGRSTGPGELGAAFGRRSPKAEHMIDAMQTLALADAAGLLGDADAAAVGLSADDRQQLAAMLQGEIAASETMDRNALVLGGLTVAATGLGFYLLFR